MDSSPAAILENALAEIRRTAPNNNHNQTPRSTPTNYKPGRRHYILYHGTNPANAISIEQSGFRMSADGMLGPGLYLSRDINKARRHGTVVFGCVVRVGKVKKIDSQNHPLRVTWRDQGYDSAWCPPNCGMTNNGYEETCIKSLDQILRYLRVEG